MRTIPMLFILSLLTACVRVTVNGETLNAIPRQDPLHRGQCVVDQRVAMPVPQETSSTCWAASAQSVLAFHGINLRQCEIVNSTKSRHSPVCCEDPDSGDCTSNGWPHEVFDALGVRYRTVRGPLSQRQIAAQLCQNGPIAFGVVSRGGGHSGVLVNYRMDHGKMVLSIDGHEKRSGFQEVSYSDYLRRWRGARGYTYIEVRP